MNLIDASSEELIFRKLLNELWVFAAKGTAKINNEDPPKFCAIIRPNDNKTPRDFLKKSMSLFVDEMACALGSNGFEVLDFMPGVLVRNVDGVFNTKQYPHPETVYKLFFTWQKDSDNKNRVYTHYTLSTPHYNNGCPQQQFTV